MSLDWFELEVAPLRLRVAVVPNQPVLFGYTPEGQEQGVTYLVDTGQRPEAVATFIVALSAMLDETGVLSTPCETPELCFDDGFMTVSSVHFRIARDGVRWQCYFESTAMPPVLRDVCERARTLATELVHGLPVQGVSGQQALKMLQRRRSIVPWLLLSVAPLVALTILWLLLRERP